MTPGTHSDTRRSWTARLSGGAALLLLVALLTAAGLTFYVVEFALPGHREETAANEQDNVRRQIGSTAGALGRAAGDGELTDAEIGAAAPRHWAAHRSSDAVRVVARFGGGEALTCGTFTLPLPLGPTTAVRVSERPGGCPEATAHPS
ncbi:hypothetical protein [Streptomyces sp. NPDC048560]|uniref:hypothetical protein n=1 Tax=Streptomyces sp. NPDC048560 TaxID=3155488 RepID=UPI00343BE188